jgi:hypothetical protein
MTVARDDVDWRQVDSGLAELASAEVQRRAWLHPIPDRVLSLEEAWARVYDDSALGWALDRDASGLPPHVIDMFRALSRQLRRVNLHQPLEAMIDSSEMASVRSLAGRIRGEIWSSTGGDDR